MVFQEKAIGGLEGKLSHCRSSIINQVNNGLALPDICLGL